MDGKFIVTQQILIEHTPSAVGGKHLNESQRKQGGHETQKYNDICKVHRTILGTYKWLLSDGKYTDNHRVLWGRRDNSE